MDRLLTHGSWTWNFDRAKAARRLQRRFRNPRDAWTPNVPPPDFDHDLRRIVEIFQSFGVVVWLLTSGDAFMTDEFRGREDAYCDLAEKQGKLINLGGIKSFRELEEIHARYNETIRRVGADLGVPVGDLAERLYHARAAEHLFTPVDAIHPNGSGHALEAEALYRQFKAAHIVGPGTRWRNLQPAAPH